MEDKYIPEIIPLPYAEDFNGNTKQPMIGISQMSVTYTQIQDTSSPIPPTQDDQYLTIESVSADLADRDGIKKKENYYYTIKTDRWAINDASELQLVVNDFKKRLYMVTHSLESTD